MTMLQSIFPFLLGNVWMATIDLQDTYFRISIHPAFRNYLRFTVGDAHFQYAALPFDLSSSPRVFTKCMIVTATYLRLQGIQIFQYIDDWLLVASSWRHLHHISLTFRLSGKCSKFLDSLGIVVNNKQSCFQAPAVHRGSAGLCLIHGVSSSRPGQNLAVSCLPPADVPLRISTGCSASSGTYGSRHRGCAIRQKVSATVADVVPLSFQPLEGSTI